MSPVDSPWIPAQATRTYVFDFSEGDKDQKDLLGGKGANLAEMVKLGLPGAAGVHDLHRGVPGVPDRRARCPKGWDARSPSTGRRWRRPAGRSSVTRAIRCWCRCGRAKFSMPGMMETVLNIGLNDDSGARAGGRADTPRFAWDSYRRLIQMFGKTVQAHRG